MTCDRVHDLVNETDGAPRYGRTICADVVALDQTLVYNRFGSFNPYGMMYALRRDVVPATLDPEFVTASACDDRIGTEVEPGDLEPGQVRLEDCKRPRPLTLRANAGDILHLRLENLLRESVPGVSQTFCRAKKSPAAGDPSFGNLYHFLRRWVSEGEEERVAHGEDMCRTDLPENDEAQGPDGNWPATRGVNFAIQGLHAFGIDESGGMTRPKDACIGLETIPPGNKVDCYFRIDREGPFFMASTAAPSGGQGDGGSLTHGLFGAVMAEPEGSSWYRSQVSNAAFREVWPAAENGVRHAIAPPTSGAIHDLSHYETLDENDEPVLNMLRALDGQEAGDSTLLELVHSDLNAIVHDPEAAEDDMTAFREFSVFFHDELKTFYTRNFEELGDFGSGQLAGVRDGFAINYGASGMGDMVLANRKGIGPAANCKECLYEEFFLTSWANGDPALLEQYSDDPSNVHHSYLNDPVVFRNFHAGPKETHVFHLHAHQWFAGNDHGRGSYLDSQTVAPQQGFTYDIYDGGMEIYHRGEGGGEGWYETLGSGNRNRTVGDSIFHCHLYPHFAQGMWELWRVHDTLEDGTRKLPDGQWEPDLSLAEMDKEIRGKKRPGSVHPETGRWIKPDTEVDPEYVGTPVPAVVPLPDKAWPLLPSYPDEDLVLSADGEVTENDGDGVEPAEEITTFPGYPYYIGGKPGHRPPQPPMDIARELENGKVTAEYLDGGLPRHVVTDEAERTVDFSFPDLPPMPAGIVDLAAAEGNTDLREREAAQNQLLAKALALGDLTMHLETAQLRLLDYDGEPIERTGMGFHHDGTVDGTALALNDALGNPISFSNTDGGYASLGAAADIFAVNGAPASPGAPFADPCGAPDELATVSRASSDSYLVETDAGQATLYAAPAGTSLSPVPPTDAQNKATDAEVSNWVRWWRTDRPDQPVLFHVDPGSGNAVALGTPAVIEEEDPFLRGTEARLMTDPAVVGFRRFEASAVQVDLITNRAGWHDPQARINVLTEDSNTYKEGGGRISPKVTATEEPFFFRALSGECIEFRHTNELPKQLELDDFQVKTPTDTIGQHIHLVKFDVTSSDGSSNGFNYEDGTFAPDEIALRICAAKNDPATAADIVGNRGPGEKAIREFPGLCVQDGAGHWKVADDFKEKIWRLCRNDPAGEGCPEIAGQKVFPELFQTTAQRWFADPILSATRAPADKGGVGDHDRTLRTVFSHDHFAPSSIQQHGFYTALLIEPQEAQICDLDEATGTGIDCTQQRLNRDLVTAGDIDIGARKFIIDRLPIGPAETEEMLEYAVSIADFSTLYDPRDSVTEEELLSAMESEGGGSGPAGGDHGKGMAMLLCEAQYAEDELPAQMKDLCGSDLAIASGSGAAHGNLVHGEPGDLPPAWLAAGMPGDSGHASALLGNQMSSTDVDALRTHLVDWRARAAGFDPADPEARLARPVAAPARPESISVDHHDPYLVSYKGEPLALRFGTSSSGSPSDCALQEPEDWEAKLRTGVTERCHVDRQRPDLKGDLANVFLSKPHGDPATPIIDAEAGDKVSLRLIHGAQEVQHTFNIDGFNWTRNIDQPFPMDMTEIDDVSAMDALSEICRTSPELTTDLYAARFGRPDQYRTWKREGSSGFGPSTDQAFWQKFETYIAQCFNGQGRVTAQEVGISEHFEFQARYLHDTTIIGVLKARRSVDEALRRDRVGPDTEESLRELAQTYDGPSDSLVHFGSQDALWNGAWTLLRVYGPETPVQVVLPDNIRDLLNEPLLNDLGRQNPNEPIEDELRRRLRALAEGLRAIEPDLLDPPVAPEPALPRVAPPRLRLPDPRDAQQGGTFDPIRFDPDNLLFPTIPDDFLFDPNRLDELVSPLPPAVLDLVRGTVDDFNAPVDRAAPDVLSVGTLDLARRRADQVREGQLRAIERDGIPFGRIAPRIDLGDFPWWESTEIPDYEVVAECRRDMPKVHTAIVAIESALVFDANAAGERGTDYSDVLYDRDGLFFALVDPRRLLVEDPRNAESVTAADLETRSNWLKVPLERILKAVRATYERPEPLVLTVQAGDCVKVTMLNAQRSIPGRNPGLHDAPGDAEMPKIVSLNVEPDWRYDEDDPEKPLKARMDEDDDVVPSARLAISIPLPVLNRKSSIAQPIGTNPMWSLAGIPDSDPAGISLTIDDVTWDPSDPKVRTAQIEQFEFYAGLAFAPAESTTRALLLSRNVEMVESVRASLPVEIERLVPPVPDTQEDAEVPQVEQSIRESLARLRDATQTFQDSVTGILARSNISLGGSLALVPAHTYVRLSEVPEERVMDEDIARAVRELGPFVIAPDGDTRTEPVTLLDALAERVRADDLSLGRIPGIVEEIAAADEEFVGLVAQIPLLTFDTLAELLDVQWHPYAFGAVPIKSHSDVIGQTAHGLIGAITVVPQEAKVENPRASRRTIDRGRAEWFYCFFLRDNLIEFDLESDRRFAPRSWIFPRRCTDAVIVPGAPEHALDGLWTSMIETEGPDDAEHRIRQFTLFWQDGLNFRDVETKDEHLSGGANERLVANCAVCDDSYDWGERGTSYHSEPFHIRLRGEPGISPNPEVKNNLNLQQFGPRFFKLKPGEMSLSNLPPMPVLRAVEGEEVVIHVVHPGGRARQRAFPTIAQDYDDLFPGFGFPRAALLAPGKAITASLTRPAEPGCYLWFDGPLHLRAGGAWGLLDVGSEAEIERGVSHCERDAQ